MWMRPRFRDVLGVVGILLVGMISLRIAGESLLVYSLTLLICGLATAVIAWRKGWSGEGLFGWFLLGTALPLVGLVVVLFRRPLTGQAHSGDHKG